MAAYRMFPPVGPNRADELAAGDTSVGFGPGTLGTHMMRKTFANRLYERLGHQNVNSTVQYLHVDQEEINAAIRAS